MSSRSFFSIRQIYPAFVFLLAVLLTNPQWMFSSAEVGNNVSSSILIGIIAVIGLSPLGVVVTLPWHILLGLYRMKFIRFRHSEKYIKEIIKKGNCTFLQDYDYKGSFNFDSYKLMLIRDYVYHFLISKREGNSDKMDKDEYKYIRTFLSRRWDLINTLGGGVISVLTGSIIGYNIVKPWFNNGVKQIVLNNLTINIINKDTFLNVTKLNITNVVSIKIFEGYNNIPENYWGYFWAFSILFIVLSIFSIVWINNERQNMIISLIRESLEKKYKNNPEKLLQDSLYGQIKTNLNDEQNKEI